MSISDLLAEIQNLTAMVTQLKDRSDRQESLMTNMMSNIFNIIPPGMLGPEMLPAINSVRQIYDLPPLDTPNTTEIMEEPIDSPPSGFRADEARTIDIPPDHEFLEGPVPPFLFQMKLPIHTKYAMVEMLYECDRDLRKEELYGLPDDELQRNYDLVFRTNENPE
jgi:hypothetical protein